MKKLIILLADVFMTAPVISQTYFDKSNFENQIDFTSKTIKIEHKGNLIDGSFEMMTDKSFKEYMIVKGNNNFESGIPESFNVLVKEIRALGLNIELN